MQSPAEETPFYRVLVAIETDATRYYGANASRPRILDTADADQMLAHLAADLKALLPDISDCSLIAAGALFDQTQLLRPEYPVFRALEAVPVRRDADSFQPQLVSIGASDGEMPVGDLQPLEDIPLGLLQLLPIAVQGPAERIAELGQAMEYRFIEEGQVSAHSAAWLETAFGIAVTHARFMTLTDLNAMLRLQLDHFGFLPLWELLDAALTGREAALSVETPSGQVFEWRDGRVVTTFETFDHWASRGAGQKVMASRQALAGGYADWTRELRQYLTTLKAHGISLEFREAAGERPLAGTFFTEASDRRPRPGDAAITEHSFEELGTVAITACDGEQIENFYPLSPQGLNDVHAHLRRLVPGGQTVAFPGTLLYDEKTRRLKPDIGDTAPRH
jgi:hypothetical protein